MAKHQNLHSFKTSIKYNNRQDGTDSSLNLDTTFLLPISSLSDGRSVSPSGEKCLIIKQEIVDTHSELHGATKRAQFRPFILYPCQCPIMGRWPKSMATMSTSPSPSWRNLCRQRAKGKHLSWKHDQTTNSTWLQGRHGARYKGGIKIMRLGLYSSSFAVGGWLRHSSQHLENKAVWNRGRWKIALRAQGWESCAPPTTPASGSGQAWWENNTVQALGWGVGLGQIQMRKGTGIVNIRDDPEALEKWKSLSCVQLFATPWTVVHGILQTRVLEWVAFPSPGDLPQSPYLSLIASDSKE